MLAVIKKMLIISGDTNGNIMAMEELIGLRYKLAGLLKSFDIKREDDDDYVTFNRRDDYITASAICSCLRDAKKHSLKMRRRGEDEVKATNMLDTIIED